LAGLRLLNDYPLPLPLLPRVPPEDEDPEERDGGDTDEPRELLPPERGVTLLGREAGRAGAALGREG